MSASPRTRSGATDHSSSSSRTSVSAGLSPRSTAPPAPSAQRPGHDASQAARRPASQRPSAERVTHSAATLREASPSTSRSAQRDGCSSSRRRSPESAWPHQPRGEPVVARRAALAQRVDRGVGGGHVLARRLVGLVAPVGVDRVDVPGAAGEQGGRGCHSYILPPHDSQAPVVVGVGLRGRAAGRRPRLRGLGARDAGLRRGARGRRRASRTWSCVPPRLDTPYSSEAADRIAHAQGKSYLDTIRAFRGPHRQPARRRRVARAERDVEAVLEWAAGANVAVDPLRRRHERRRRRRGPRARALRRGRVARPVAASTACSRSTRVSRAARVQPGASGPRLEEQLGAARDDDALLPAVVRAVDASAAGSRRARAGTSPRRGRTSTTWSSRCARSRPTGVWESRRLPGSGAGPSPDRMLLGCEGILGVITEAWVRVQPKPEHRASRAVRFRSFAGGAEAVREIVQSGLRPANCRLVDELEARPDRGGRRRPRAARARLRGPGPGGRPPARPGAGGVPRARRRVGRGRRRRRRLARGVPADALPARRADAARRAGRHVRDGDHLGALRGLPRAGRGRDARGARRAVPRDLPLHARVSRRPGALLHGDRARAPRATRSRSGTR